MLADRLLLDKVDFDRNVIVLDGKEYEMTDTNFPTVDPKDPFRLTEDERALVKKLHNSFVDSEKLRKHMDAMFRNGCIFNVVNGNLLYHASIPLNADGSLKDVTIQGRKYHGKSLLKKVGALIREAYFGADDGSDNSFAMDYVWYLWCGKDSPAFDKDKMATFERYFIKDKATHKETKGYYYTLRDSEEEIGRAHV